MYGPSSASSVKRTVISGMRQQPAADSGPVDTKTNDRATVIDMQERTLAGILYSVSRDSMGELFPIYLGRNTIGSEPECDVYLPEDTVSANHAVLLVRMVPDTSGQRVISAGITDYDSEFGTALNDNPLGYDREPLNANDVIRVGNSYQLMFVPLDAISRGLTEAPGFRALPRKDGRRMAVATGFYAPASEEEIYPSEVGEEYEQTFYGRTYARKEDHSSKKTVL